MIPSKLTENGTGFETWWTVTYFDANWNLRLHDAKMQESYEEDLRRAQKLGIAINDHEDPEECDRIAKDLFLVSSFARNGTVKSCLISALDVSGSIQIFPNVCGTWVKGFSTAPHPWF